MKRWKEKGKVVEKYQIIASFQNIAIVNIVKYVLKHFMKFIRYL